MFNNADIDAVMLSHATFFWTYLLWSRLTQEIAAHVAALACVSGQAVIG